MKIETFNEYLALNKNSKNDEISKVYWEKREYDANDKVTYYENGKKSLKKVAQ